MHWIMSNFHYFLNLRKPFINIPKDEILSMVGIY